MLEILNYLNSHLKFCLISDQGSVLLDKFENAIESDFTNGVAKTFFYDLMTFLLQRANIDGSSMTQCITSVSDKQNCEIRIKEVRDTLRGKRPHESSSSSSSSSLYHSPTSARNENIAVPDGVIALAQMPGSFALVYEAKSTKELGNGEQNLKQMLSRMFFQDIIFGVTCSPVAFVIQAVLKVRKEGPETNELQIMTSGRIELLSLSHDDDALVLNVVNLNKLVLFIYNILKWCDKNRCILYS